MSQIVSKIVKIFFKQNCFLCKQSAEDVICGYCYKSLQQQLNFQRQELDIGFDCDYYYLLKYSPEVRYLLQKFKFQKDLLSGTIFARLILNWWSTVSKRGLVDVDAIAVVPIHRFRYLYRGFNQAEVLANVLAEFTGVPTTFENYSRVKYTKSQAKSSKHKRAEQIKGVFSLDKPIMAKHLVIFDDVLTTGSTIKEFIETLLEGSQIGKISIVTLVRPE